MMITYVHEQCFIIFINLYIHVSSILLFHLLIILQRMLTHESLLLYYYIY